MGSALQNTLATTVGVEFILGNLGNGFIALVNCVDWIKQRKISSVDQILTALAVSRIGQLWLVLICILLNGLYPSLLMTEILPKVIFITWTITNHFSVWLATSLSIFYFLKIANFSNSTFFFLKRRVTKVVLATLLISLVFLVLNTVQINSHIDSWIGSSKTNMSYSSNLRNLEQFSQHLFFTSTIFVFIAFIISLITFLLLIFSLCKHLKKVQNSSQGIRDVSTTAHVKALLTVVTFLLLYTIFFLSFLLQACNTEFLKNSHVVLLSCAVGLVFPSGHSWVLILGNSKLKQASLSVLTWLRCRSKDTEPSGP